MDINSDMGELDSLLDDGTYEKLMSHVTSVNIACGGHAGDKRMMSAIVKMAKEKGVKVGAHPSFPDQKNFGRVNMDLEKNQLLDSIESQIQLLVDVASNQNVKVSHVKPHGALYNTAVNDRILAQTIGEAILKVNPFCTVMGLAGSKMLTVLGQMGLNTMAEAFADRTYESDGTLRNRKLDHALITDPQIAGLQAKSIKDGFVNSIDGKLVQIKADTLCIHSDTPNAVEIAQSVCKNIDP